MQAATELAREKHKGGASAISRRDADTSPSLGCGCQVVVQAAGNCGQPKMFHDELT